MSEKYSEEKCRTIQNLLEGNWNAVKIDIPTWLESHEYDILCALICGCQKNKDINILYILSHLLTARIANPNAEKYSEEKLKEIIFNENPAKDTSKMTYAELTNLANIIIVSNCCLVIKEIIWTIDELKHQSLSNEDEEKCNEILNNLGKNPNRYVRIYVAGATDRPDIFLKDSDLRVKKIAAIRSDFNSTINRSNSDLEKQIDFITCALETGVIKQSEGLGLKTEEDIMYAKFDSLLFTPDTKYYEFDRDIFYNIKDQRVLALEIIKMLEIGALSFSEGMTPTYFKKGIKKLEKK